jgi:hypothetical protein
MWISKQRLEAELNKVRDQVENALALAKKDLRVLADRIAVLEKKLDPPAKPAKPVTPAKLPAAKLATPAKPERGRTPRKS